MHTATCLGRRSLLSLVNPVHCHLPLRQNPVPYQRLAPLTQPYLPSCRQLSTSQFSPAKEPRKALSFWGITFTFLVAAGGVWFQDKYFPPSNHSHASDSLPVSPSSPVPDSIDTSNMTINTQIIPLGTVGNLTAEQEAKLRELWVLTAEVCGIALNEGGEQQQQEQAPQSPPQKKKTKRKYTWYGKTYHEPDDSASTTSANVRSSSIVSLSTADADDKFGQSKEFKLALEEMTPEEIRTTFWNMVKHNNPDALMLRFLRARKWDVKKALVMLISTIRWRLLEIKVDDDIMKNGEALARKQTDSTDPGEKKAGEEFLRQLRMGKTFFHGVDKAGRPICIVRVRLHKWGDQSEKTMERLTVFTIETGRLMLVPPVETATVIFDMTNFTLANMVSRSAALCRICADQSQDYMPVKFIIKCFEANYPESLGAILIHKAPWIFSGLLPAKFLASKTNNVRDLEHYQGLDGPGGRRKGPFYQRCE